jgi:anthranilate synthase component 1
MAYPDYAQYLEDVKAYRVVPVFVTLAADFETPVTIFLKSRAIFLLESVERGEHVGRYSIMALDKRREFILQGTRLTSIHYHAHGKKESETANMENPLPYLREFFQTATLPAYEGMPPFFSGAIGYLGYEAIQYFEKVPLAIDQEAIPDGWLVVPETLLIYDSLSRSLHVVVTTFSEGDAAENYQRAEQRIAEVSRRLGEPLPLEASAARPQPIASLAGSSKDDFLQNVEKAKGYIREGDIFQVVVSLSFQLPTAVLPFAVYRSLRVLNPSPYLYYLDFGPFTLVGSSPEVMVRRQENELLIKPIAGTRPRGRNLKEDEALARELLADEKERAEHLMLVDLGRNDLGRVSLPGTVEVSDFMKVERFSHVMHMVSTVKGELDESHDIFDVIGAVFPAGTLTGAPKIRAMEIITELEKKRRNTYGGMVFYLGFNGSFDSCITIRTILFKQGQAIIQAGAGIVADSQPEREYQEVSDKARVLLQAVQLAEDGRIS